MSIKTKTAAALAALTLATTLALPASEAQARGWGVAAIIGGAIVAGAVASAYSTPVYADGYRRCRFVRQYDGYGMYVGTAKVCTYY